MDRAIHTHGVRSRAPMDPVVRKLGRLRELSESELHQVERLARRRENFQSGQEVCAEGQRTECKAILSGWAARTRELSDGRRQIFAFLLPGDIVGMRGPTIGDSSVIALTKVETADLSLLREDLESRSARSSLHEACTIAAELDERMLLNHIVRLGRLTASQRLAHILLELGERLSLAQDINPSQFSLPVTQENLADALGLSLVHMNRTIQTLRRENLVKLKGRLVCLLERDRLMTLADFSPLQPTPRDFERPQRSAREWRHAVKYHEDQYTMIL